MKTSLINLNIRKLTSMASHWALSKL